MKLVSIIKTETIKNIVNSIYYFNTPSTESIRKKIMKPFESMKVATLGDEIYYLIPYRCNLPYVLTCEVKAYEHSNLGMDASQFNNYIKEQISLVLRHDNARLEKGLSVVKVNKSIQDIPKNNLKYKCSEYYFGDMWCDCVLFVDGEETREFLQKNSLEYYQTSALYSERKDEIVLNYYNE